MDLVGINGITRVLLVYIWLNLILLTKILSIAVLEPFCIPVAKFTVCQIICC
jgi:hypothetical protein